jgi:DNA-binding CsgD family transcriptional regulator
MVVEDADQALDWGTRALELARRLDDTEAVVYALSNMGAARFEGGDHEGRAMLERALALAQRHGLEEYCGRGFQLLARSSARLRLFEVAGDYAQAGLEYCRQHDLDTWRLYLLACRARLELDLGRWSDAADSAATVLRDPRSAPVPRNSALTTLGVLRIRRGDPDASTPLLQAHELARSTGEVNRTGPIAAAMAEQAWLSGDTTKVGPATDDVLSLARRRRALWVVDELRYWRWQAGLREELAGEATPYGLSIVGKWAEAAELWKEIGCPYETALALGASRDDQAVRAAIDQLQGMGARPAAAVLARRLRRRGVRGIPRGPRPQTRLNPAGLTARELEVLTHLTEGMRNAQIARALVVSEKTVDHHVSSVLRKLGVQTRGEASAEALRLGLSAPT